MHGKHSKKSSKRIKLNKKYKIEKKVKQHYKKLKRDKKRHPEKYAKKKSDPGVPNSCPFKTQLIYEAKEVRESEEDRRNRMNKELKMRRKEDKQNIFNKNRNLEEVVHSAEKRTNEYEIKSTILEKEKLPFSDRSSKAYFKEFKKVIEAADVILEVLDARDPQGSRCLLMEELVKCDPSKRLVLILNKADLVPKSNLEAWLKYLRTFYPTLLFKSSTQNQAGNIGRVKTKSFVKTSEVTSSKCIGADLLIQLLKNYSRNKDIKTSIVVGIIGMPNVGKSSLINSLKRSRACNVGATAGVTKSMQEVSLDSKVRLLDCPGIIFPKKDASDEVSSLRNALRVEDVNDPILPIEAILERAGKDKIMLRYQLPNFKNTAEFLALYASKSGLLAKGGRPKMEDAARAILHDWNTGRINYYTIPPVQEDCNLESVVLPEYSKEFDLDTLAQTDILSSLPDVRPSQTMCVEGLPPVEEVEDQGDQEQGHNDTKLLQNVVVEVNCMNDKKSSECVEEKKNRWETESKPIDISKVSLKKIQKKADKKLRKEKNRNLRRVEDLSDAFENCSTLNHVESMEL